MGLFVLTVLFLQVPSPIGIQHLLPHGNGVFITAFIGELSVQIIHLTRLCSIKQCETSTQVQCLISGLHSRVPADHCHQRARRAVSEGVTVGQRS